MASIASQLALESGFIDGAIIGAKIIEPEIVGGKIVGGRIIDGRIVDLEPADRRFERARGVDAERRDSEIVAVVGLGLTFLLTLLL